MPNPKLEPVLSWMKETDLVEVRYAAQGETLALRVEGAPPTIPPAAIVCVSAPAVGVFRFSRPGRPRTSEKGASVKPGDALGHVESGSKRIDVKTSVPGRVVRVLVSDAQAVEYGRPLFLIEPS